MFRLGLVEINFTGLPFFGEFREDDRDEPEDRARVRKKTGDLGAALDLCVEGLAHVGDAEPFVLVVGEAKDGPSFRNGLFH